jgi:hypothetical protein
MRFLKVSRSGTTFGINLDLVILYRDYPEGDPDRRSGPEGPEVKLELADPGGMPEYRSHDFSLFDEDRRAFFDAVEPMTIDQG